MALPKQNLNPFALIQQSPSAWQGLIGKTSSGFLIFQSAYHGVRAGFINLINTYLNRGLDTIEKILPVYAPAGHGSNDPGAYISTVERITGIPRNKKIETEADLFALGKAIVQVEEGNFWVSLQDFEAGFKAAISEKNFKKVAVVAAGSGLGILFLVGLIGYLIMNKNKERTQTA
ncbi:MAG: hypothetical protein JNJ65_15620 [Cyclobacteriaceae bacterium]|nr:hypothetical protein [Cyclobacteriaceae bacterium]